MKKQDCFLFGTIFKLHGYKGEVNIYNDNNIPLMTNKVEFLYLEEDSNLVPYFVESIRQKKKNILLVKFDSINSEEEAIKILKQRVFLPDILKPKESHSSKEKIIQGFSVIDKKMGKIGTVHFVDNQSPQRLIKVINKDKEFFIPFHANFIDNIDEKNNILEVSIPKELLNIN